MKLQDFLKVKKVRCFIGDATVTTGRVYDVVGLDKAFIHVIDDNGEVAHYWYTRFEPVLDDMSKSQDDTDTSADSVGIVDWSTAPDGFDWWAKDKDGMAYWFDDLPRKQGDCWGGPCNFEKTTIYLNDKPWHESLERRPKSEQVLNDDGPHVREPRFKVGDRVYRLGSSRIYKVVELDDELNELILEDSDDDFSSEYAKACCHATQENYEQLQTIFPDFEFEQPSQPLTGSDLCRAMLEKGWVAVPCYISDESDYDADNNAFCALIGKFDKCFKELATNYEHEYAVPFDPRTGEVLTEAALDE